MHSQVYFNDLVLIDLTSYSTTVVNAVEAHLPTPIANSTLSVVGDKIFVFGGTDAQSNCYNDLRYIEVAYYLNPDDITVGEGAASDYSFKILIIGDACKCSVLLLYYYYTTTIVLLLLYYYYYTTEYSRIML